MKRFNGIFVSGCIGFVCAALIAGCDSESSKDYDVTVRWEISGFSACQSAPLPAELGGQPLIFKEMRITVYEEEGDTEPYVDSVSVTCSQKEYTINGLERGEYFVLVEAIATHDGQTLPYFRGDADITAPADNDDTYPVELRLNTGSVTVAWDFQQGNCSHEWNSVVLINVYLDGYNGVVSQKDLDCDDSQVTFTGLSWDLYRIEVQGFDAAGDRTHVGYWTDAATDNRLDVRPGSSISGQDAFVVLEPIDP